VLVLTHKRIAKQKFATHWKAGVRGYLLLGCSLRELSDGIRSVYRGGVALGSLVQIALRRK